METVVVIDFETTGLDPGWGDRAIEIAIVVVRDGSIVDSYQSLMNPGRRIPAEVTQLTGITNDMVARAPLASKVMREASRFVGSKPVVAHNASFDRKFWDAELERLSLSTTMPFACTMLLSRRLYPDSPNHKLATLVDFLKLPKAGRAHRAMADAQMASQLWSRIQNDVAKSYGVRGVCHEILTCVQRVPRAQVPTLLGSYR